METNLNPTQSPILTGWQEIWSWSLRLPSLPQDVSGTLKAGAGKTSRTQPTVSCSLLVQHPMGL